MATQWLDSDWDIRFYSFIQFVEVMRTNWMDAVVTLGQHDDSRTEQEITQLHARIPERNGPRRQDILDQDQPGGVSAAFEKKFNFNQTTKPATIFFVRAVVQDGAGIVFYAKNIYRRRRPVQLDPTLITKPGNHVIDTPAHPAYPSGHSFQSHLVALALTDLGLPAAGLTTLARSIAENREIAGLHYPSDSVAGEWLARELWTTVQANAHLRKMREQARREWP